MSRPGNADASEFLGFAKDIVGVGRAMAGALTTTLGEIADEAQSEVSSSTETPYKTGFVRGSVEDNQDGPFDFSLSSPVPYSRIWDLGGTVIPSGSPIVIPRTEYATRAVREAGDDADEKLAGALEAEIVRRGFTP